MGSSEFSIRRILHVIVGGRLFAVAALAAFSIAPAVKFTWDALGELLVGRGEDAIMLVLALFAVLYVASTFRVWWIRRRELSAIEHRVVLGLLVLVSSLALGYTNFAIYTTNHDAFAADTSVNSWIMERNNELRAEARQSANTSEWCASILHRLDSLSATQFPFKHSWLPRFLWREFPVDLPIKGLEVKLLYSRATKDIPFDTWSLQIREGMRSVLVNQFNQVGSEPLPPPGTEGVSKQYIINAVQLLAKWEAHRSVILVAHERPSIPAAAFVYQSLMTVLGDNPHYVAPNAGVTRALALFFAVAKFLYAAVFITLFANSDRRSEVRSDINGG